MRARSSLEAVEQELILLGISYRVCVNKHAKIYVQCGGREHLYVCSQNGQGRHRAIENSRAGIRRLLKQIGVIAPNQKRG